MRQAYAKDGVVLPCHMCISGAGKNPSPRLRPAHTTAVPPQYSRGKWRSQGKVSMERKYQTLFATGPRRPLHGSPLGVRNALTCNVQVQYLSSFITIPAPITQS